MMERTKRTNQFSQQLKSIEKRILSYSFTRSEFPQVVQKVLQQSHLTFSRKSFFKEFLKLNRLPHQYYQPTQFGSFNATLLRNEQFTIQLYIMDNESTELHRHSFFGFYLYLEGDSLELCLKKTDKKIISKNVHESDYEIVSSRLYKPLHGRVIYPKLIHQVHRLSEKTTILMFMHNDFIQRSIEFFCPPYFVKNAKFTDLENRKMLILLNNTDEKQTALSLKLFKTDKLILIRGRMEHLRFFNHRSKIKNISSSIDGELLRRKIKVRAFTNWLERLEKIKTKALSFK